MTPGPQYHELPEHPRANMVLGLGIAGFFFGIFGLIAWIIGDNAHKEIKNGAPYK